MMILKTKSIPIKRILIAATSIFVMMGTLGAGSQKAKAQDNFSASVITNPQQANDYIKSKKALPLQNILQLLEEHYDVNFLYKGGLVANKMVENPKIQIGDKTGEQLSKIIDKLGLKLHRVNETSYIVLPKPFDGKFEQQMQMVSGTVTDASTGESMPGVNVVLKGTTTGTSTDSEGQYDLEVPSLQDTLVFSFIGYQTQEIPINGRTQIDVDLQPQAVTGEDLIVVGYGEQQRSQVSGAVSQVSSEEIADNPAPNLLQGLRGKAAGVNIYTNSGSPTGTNRVVIRGVGSLNSNTDPLWVVDGVAMNNGIEFLNPNDIESIEVLKDASATAIYGARGANGVILVTTSRGGEFGQEGVTVTVNSSVSMGTRRGKIDLLNSEEFMEVQRRGFQNAPLFDEELTAPPELDLSQDTGGPRALFDENGNPLFDTDWQEELSRMAVSTNHQIGVQGGNPKSSYGAFLNYNRTEGVLQSSYLKRASIKLVYDSEPFEWLRIGSNMMINRTWSNELNETTGGFAIRRTMLEFAPILPVKWPNGEWTQHADVNALGLEGMGNPAQTAREHKNLRDRMQIFGNTYLEFNILPNLEFRTQFGIDNVDREQREFAGRNLRSFGGFPDGQANVFNEETTFWQVENFATYDNDFGPHSINVVGGASWQQNDFFNFSASVEGFTSDFSGFNNLDAASIINAPTSDEGKWTINSYWLRKNYTFDDRYNVTFTARVDGSSRFGDNQKYGFFPSVGAGWTITNEPYMQNKLDFLDNLRLRGSWGRTGNTEIGLFNSLATVGSGTSLLSGERVNTAFATRLPNPDLKWEVTRQWDIGIEFEAFDQFLEVQADYYNKRTNDLIIDRPIPASSGFGFVTDNVGSVLNQGADVKITTNNIRTDRFQWSSTLNFNYNFNKIKDLGPVDQIFPGPFFVSGSQTVLQEGQAVNSFFAFERLGTWQLDEAEEAAQVGAVPGEAKRSDTRSIQGRGLPDWQGSFIHRFSYKNWDFTADFEFAANADIAQQFIHTLEDRTGLANSLSTVLENSFTPENQNTPIQRIRNFPLSGQNSQFDSAWITDGTYLRGNQFALSYTFDQGFLSNYGLQSVRLTASVDNAFVVTTSDFKGFDPVGTSQLGPGDAANAGGQFGQNIFFHQFPKPRTVTFKANIRF